PGSPLGCMKDVCGKLGGIVSGDITDLATVERIFNEYEVNTCFHLAAQALVGVANRSPLSTFESNIKGTWNVLEAARNSKTFEGMVVASSDKAYGEHENLPYTEEFCLNALHPYDASKACADILARTYFNTYGLSVAVTRCANIYGGGDLNFSRIIPDTIQSILSDKPPIIRSDGTPVRDYMYIADAVGAYLTLAEKLGKVKGEAFNFGTNSPIGVSELVDKIIKISGKTHLRPIIKGEAKGEINMQYLKSEKAANLLGWKPKYSLEEGLKETIAWYDKYFASM
ncbi:GDP-mannose 4,6-dehydratase, partial [archaeon]|nr:GDP-mannose 4,6-dehydratase [archaeon]